MQKLEIKHLHLVRAIAETKNLTKAAKQLNISQPALSRQLLDIENQLDTRLFFRTPKKMVLTNAGEIVLSSADRVLHEIKEAEDKIHRLTGDQTGELIVGIGCPLSYQWLPSVMESFHSYFPNVDIQIGHSSDLINDLIEKKFDVVITTEHLGNANVTYEFLFVGEAIAIFRPGHPF